MLKKLSINSYTSRGKKAKDKGKEIKNLYLIDINNVSNNSSNPIKIIPKNKTFYNKIEFNSRHIKDRDNILINKKFKKFNDIYKNLNLSNNNSREKNRNSYNKKSNSYFKDNHNNNYNKYYLDISNINKDKIINMERCLTQNENNFKRNVSQQILRNKKLSDNLIDKVTLLKQKINNNYKELKKSKYNNYEENKNIIDNMFYERRIKIQNRTNDKKIYDLKNDINNIKDKINQFKNQKNIFINEYMNIRDEVKNIKNQIKILPNSINNLEIENKKLIQMQIIIHSNIQKIKSKLFEFEHNKKNIERNLQRTNMLYNKK